MQVFWRQCRQVIHLLQAGFFFCSFLDPEDEGDTFLRNVGSHADYTALYSRRRHQP
jgi:hypothetical protein